MFDRLKAEYDTMLAAKEPHPIKVTLPDGKDVEGKAWRTTPLEIATSIRLGGEREPGKEREEGEGQEEKES